MSILLAGLDTHTVTSDPGTHNVQFGPDFLQGDFEGMRIVAVWARYSSGPGTSRVKAVYPVQSGSTGEWTWVVEFEEPSGGSASFAISATITDDSAVL